MRWPGGRSKASGLPWGFFGPESFRSEGPEVQVLGASEMSLVLLGISQIGKGHGANGESQLRANPGVVLSSAPNRRAALTPLPNLEQLTALHGVVFNGILEGWD